MNAEATASYSPGLRGVVAAETRKSSVDGLAGELIIAGYPLEELAANACFEEVVYLLWNDRLPNASELRAFSAQLAARRTLPDAVYDLLRAAAQKRLAPMDALRMAAGALSLEIEDDTDAYACAMACVAAFPTIVAAYWRLLNDQEPLSPDGTLNHTANYLYMLTGKKPSDAAVRALETYLATVVDHGLNASTFATRVIISTDSDMISAVVGAIGALKGPRHGGAPGPALDMVFEIAQPENAEPYLRDKLGRGELLMGFGHRVYKVRDPRADMLAKAADVFMTHGENAKLYDLAKYVEGVALRLLEEYKPGRHLQTNVEYYTALVLHGLDLPTDLFSPTFAVARVGGWTAHAFEQQDEGSILRPESIYTGDKTRRWVAIEDR